MIALGRRTFVAGSAAMLAAPAAAIQAGNAMFGLIGKMRAAPGQRDALIALMLEGTAGMPGCLSYIVARDSADADGIWVTEVWDSRDSHRASLQLPAVQAVIARARPLVAGFERGAETERSGASACHADPGDSSAILQQIVRTVRALPPSAGASP